MASMSRFGSVHLSHSFTLNQSNALTNGVLDAVFLPKIQFLEKQVLKMLS